MTSGKERLRTKMKKAKNNAETSASLQQASSLQTEALGMFDGLAEDASWAFEDLERKDTSYATHGFHRYPAKFIPQLARRCIEQHTEKGDLVCDPFMGCGTTLVESLVSGRKAAGVDVNPVACLITAAKITPISPDRLSNHVEKLLSNVKSRLEAGRKGVKISPVMPKNERIDHWFPSESTREELGTILACINEIKNGEVRNFCLCAFSNILKSSSIWMMKSTKPMRDVNKTSPSPYSSFSRKIKTMLRGNQELWNLMPVSMRKTLKQSLVFRKGDARSLPCKSGSVSLIVTSPPYVTSYEYADLHQLTALWLEYAKSLAEFRKGFIGSTQKKEAAPDKIKSEIAKQEIAELSGKSRREAESVGRYFLEMQECFEEMRRVLKPRGRACIVIGNTELRKVPILNAQVFVEIMLNAGFNVHRIVKRRIPSKILPQTRDSKTGRFTSNSKADRLAYSHEYVIMMEKNGH